MYQNSIFLSNPLAPVNSINNRGFQVKHEGEIVVCNKRPLIKDIHEEINEIEKTVNKLILDFKTKYNSPAVKIVKGRKYKLITEIDLGLLREQYQNTSQHTQSQEL